MQIFVRTSDGAQHGVEVPRDATVADVIQVVGLPNDSMLSFQGQQLHATDLLADAGVCAQAELQASQPHKWFQHFDLTDTYVYEINGNRIKHKEGHKIYQIFLKQMVQSAQKVTKKFRVLNSSESKVFFGVNVCNAGTGEIVKGGAEYLKELPKTAGDLAVTIIVDLENGSQDGVVMLIDNVTGEPKPLTAFGRGDNYGYYIFATIDGECEIEVLN